MVSLVDFISLNGYMSLEDIFWGASLSTKFSFHDSESMLSSLLKTSKGTENSPAQVLLTRCEALLTQCTEFMGIVE